MLHRLEGGRELTVGPKQGTAEYPLITIITSTFNAANDLHWTIESIRAQTYPNIQWIVVDGGSRDNTVDILKANEDIIDYWFSEPDNGIYDAWNKIWSYVKGEWVLFLGAGDTLLGSNNLENLSKLLNKSIYSIVYGNVAIVNTDRKLRFIRRDVNISISGPAYPALPCHQGVLHNVTLINKIYKSTPFDSSYRIAADGKVMISLLRERPAFHYDNVIAEMIDSGISNDHRNFFKMRKEVKRFSLEAGINVSFRYRVTSFIKPFILYLIYKLTPAKLKKFFDEILDKRRLKRID